MSYTPHTPDDEREMLAVLGLERLEDLFESIPRALRLERPLDVPRGRSETEILREFARLAGKNTRMDTRPSFLGAGVYPRFVPSAVDALASRGEFNTAYTPYQPEASQGTLQAIFEYQTMICRLSAMEIANASMYDGATALAEAVLMALGAAGKGPRHGARRVLLAEGIHPEYRRTVETYLRNEDVELVTLPLSGGVLDPDDVRRASRGGVTALAFQTPNFLGNLDDGAALRQALDQASPPHGDTPQETKPFLIAVVDPTSLAVLAPPGQYGADIAVGEGQSLGNYPSYGGPAFGFFATRQSHVRKLPGRVVGETTDAAGRRGYVLTFQTREQPIRRERATSNICTNQGLCSLRAAIYLSLLGEQGLREVAENSARRAHYAHALLTRIDGVSAATPAAFFNEFTLNLPQPADAVYERLRKVGVGGGLALGRYFPERRHQMLFACTELTTREDVDALALALEEVLLETEPPENEPQTTTEATTR